ncbi:hypothetical protein GGI25_006331 [Coemansia spiralis]|uniref:Uncharacterized protein n=2 Tax=Coemansia TaxID=4863 RepID=A0A9W8G0V8_9FUNG|nr:hypothetical protein BX070DRAFT_235664 [Coemansia spiralis]KAJ1993193.1 hypothetical protein EDC05_002269 [Coemansia umbellata]KAJ2622511.1 hypothetical protein GGI26_003238 [Coemansia sp. RSA 1358]KAJ2668852.1 hypothetical protein GGI25_006331 [Coemansia spiralis]
MSSNNPSDSLFNWPNYSPSKSAAFGVAAVYFALGIVLTVESVRAKNFWPSRLAVLVGLMLGGAFVARGVFAAKGGNNSDSFIAFSVLDSVAPNFINLVNYILLIILLRSATYPPSKRLIMSIRVLAIVLAVAFGAISAAGAAMLSSDSPSQLSTALKLVKASAAGQLANSLLFMIIANVLLHRYWEAPRGGRSVAIILIGGILIIARNAVRIVSAFYPKVALLRDSEAAWYCLDPLFTLIIVFTWAVLDLPKRCRMERPIDPQDYYGK